MGKMAAVCATNVPAAEKWIGDGKLPGVWDRLESHEQIDAKYLKDFSEDTLWKRVSYPMWFNRKNKSIAPIKHGLAVRLYVPLSRREADRYQNRRQAG